MLGIALIKNDFVTQYANVVSYFTHYVDKR